MTIIHAKKLTLQLIEKLNWAAMKNHNIKTVIYSNDSKHDKGEKAQVFYLCT